MASNSKFIAELINSSGKIEGEKLTLGAGGVDWTGGTQTANFTAVLGRGYFVDTNTNSQSIDITIPNTALSVGQFFAVKDISGSTENYSINLLRNGNKINGESSDLVLKSNGAFVKLVYSGSTLGWISTSADLRKFNLTKDLFINSF